MVNGLETIYPLSSRARARCQPCWRDGAVLSFRAREIECALLVVQESAVRCDVSGILGRRYRVALKSVHNTTLSGILSFLSSFFYRYCTIENVQRRRIRIGLLITLNPENSFARNDYRFH